MPIYLTVPVADGDSLVNAKLHRTANLTELTNGTAYIAYVLSNPSDPFTPLAQVDPPDPVEGPQRRVLPTDAMHAHWGHSLVDAYMHNGGFPEVMRALMESLGYTDQYQNQIKATIPGSTIQYRLDNPIEDSRPGFPSADPMLIASELDMLMFTEAGPPPSTAFPYNSGFTDSITAFMTAVNNFIANAKTKPADIIWWSIWPALDMWVNEEGNQYNDWRDVPYQEAIEEYGKRFKFYADYGTWKAKQDNPDLPEDWRIWYFPGHKWMGRLVADVEAGLVPQITDMEQLYDYVAPEGTIRDNIHPNSLCSYGLACMVTMGLRKAKILASESPFIQPQYTNQANNRTFPAVSPALAQYFWDMGWEIISEFGPAGLGGTRDTELQFIAGVTPDPLGDDDTPPDPGGELPEALMIWTATEKTGPAFSGNQPTVVDGALVFDTSLRIANLSLTGGFYTIMAVKNTWPDSAVGTLVQFGSNIAGFGKPNGGIGYSGWGQHQLNTTVEFDGAPWPEGHQLQLVQDDTWYIVESWSFGNAIGGASNGVGMPDTETQYGMLPATSQMSIMHDVGGTMTGLRVMDRMPTEPERSAMRAWASALIPTP